MVKGVGDLGAWIERSEGDVVGTCSGNVDQLQPG